MSEEKKLIAQMQLNRFTHEQVAIYRHLIRRFTRVGIRCGRVRIERDRARLKRRLIPSRRPSMPTALLPFRETEV